MTGKLPVAAFAALVVATVAAFFVTQHLKVTTPLVTGSPAPKPGVINPVSGRTCGPPGQQVDHRKTFITFYLQHRADDVSVAIVDPAGTAVKNFRKHHMQIEVRNPPNWFVWNGREDDGSIAPDGTYYYRITLLGQGRSIELTAKPITVRTTPPHPVVTSVTPSLISPPGTPVIIKYTGTSGLGATIRIYRTDLPGRPRLVKSFKIRRHGDTATWDGQIGGRPAPAGTYLIGLDATDNACNTGHFPTTLPPAPGSTAHAGVTVRYLAAQPPMTATPAGGTATVFIDSRRHPYRWALRRIESPKKIVARGGGTGITLALHLPAGLGAGLYELAIRSDAARTVVPVIADSPAAARKASVLVVLPTLNWQAVNPVDDNGDGMPDALPLGGPISLQRPLVAGLPSGFGDEAGLLANLAHQHLHYDLTTDIALSADPAAALAGRHGVVLAGSETWLPPSVLTALRAYVQGGGHVLSLGTDSLRRSVTLSAQRALDPTNAGPEDAFGARPGPLVTGNHELLTVFGDKLKLFSTTSGAFSGVRTFEPITPPGSEATSIAGTSGTTAGIVGFGLGRGLVIEIGVPGFGSALAHDVDFQELLGRSWGLLSR